MKYRTRDARLRNLPGSLWHIKWKQYMKNVEPYRRSSGDSRHVAEPYYPQRATGPTPYMQIVLRFQAIWLESGR